MLDLASGYQLVTAVPRKTAKCVVQAFLKAWVTPLGVPAVVLSDLGGEFQETFADQLESLGVRLANTAAVSPQQNAPCERAGGIWKLHARAVIDECSVSFAQGDWIVDWLCAAICWAVNSQVNQIGYSASQWVLGQGLRLPECLQSGNLALASRLDEDPEFAQRIAIQAASQRSIVGLRYSRALARAFLARSRASSTDPVASQFQIGDQVFYWRGVSEK